MMHFRRLQIALALLVLGGIIVAGTGCGLFARPKVKPPEVSEPASPPTPAATPAPPPPQPTLPPPVMAPAPPPVVTAPPIPPPPPPPLRRTATARIADEETLKSLIQGKSTKSEVRDRFGIPQEIVVAPAVETFIYYRDQTSGWFSRTTERVEMLTIRFDTRGILKDFEYRYSGK